ncbi:MAG TPA: hypothetical protein VGO81_17235, partial [Solirubrobacteraceae bacterium]|nr:hypothetical protein [Solirubrobacteraceae bacterium]
RARIGGIGLAPACRRRRAGRGAEALPGHRKRAGDSDRAAVVHLLRAHHLDGRLTVEGVRGARRARRAHRARSPLRD